VKLAQSAALAALGVLSVLGMVGLAAAQEGLIVDPWGHAVSALFPPKADPAPATRPVGVASFPIEHSAAAPAVVPVGPPLREGTADPHAPLVVAPAEPLDAAVESGPTASLHHATPSQWAWEIREIVDPWAKGPVAVAATDPLIIDPWAPRLPRRY